MFIRGIRSSWEHDQNGMTYADMEATRKVATKLNEVIIFRSTGPWAKRWLERKYPSKNFHVKGKSSDWGPQAGFVPFDGIFSKVGYDLTKAAKGTAANVEGLHSGFASKAPLVLSMEEIRMQASEVSGGRTALVRMTTLPKSDDLLLFARMSGRSAGPDIPFRAMKLHGSHHGGKFEIRAFYPDRLPSGSDLTNQIGFPLEVMTSNEVGANHMPMTGDYDLLAVCPAMADYGNQSPARIEKPGIRLHGFDPRPDFVFQPGVGMDNVIDPSLHTAGSTRTNYDAVRSAAAKSASQKRGGTQGPAVITALPRAAPEAETEVNRDGTPIETPYSLGRNEHPDMGNLTPRILRCINELNKAMDAVGDKAAFRRVHHNAESHRNKRFGALTKEDMLTMKDGDHYGDGFPLTVFQPQSLCADRKVTSVYTEVCTLTNYADLRSYLRDLTAAGYYVPRHWAWEIDSTPHASDAVKDLFAAGGPRRPERA